MGQIRTTYLETLLADPNLMGTVEPTPGTTTDRELVDLLERLLTHPTRPSRVALVGAIRKVPTGVWAKVWVTPLTLRALKPGTKTLNWTTARGKGTMEVDRKRVRLIVPETSVTSLKRATASVARNLTAKVIDLTK